MKSIYIPKNYSRDSLIYLAGIVDGEGAFVISKHRSNHKRGYNYQARLEISNTIETLIDWLVLNFDGRKSIQIRDDATHKRKNVYKWVIEGERLTHISELIYPFSTIKKSEIDIILKIRHSMEKPVVCKGKQGIQSLSQEILDYRQSLFEQLKAIHNRSCPKH